MKKLTCRELGGECDEVLEAETWDDMVDEMTNHVIENHPETEKKMEKMYEEDPTKWSEEYKKVWETAEVV